MTIGQGLLAEFEQEAASTRKVLECVQDKLLEWKADPRMNTIGWVAKHVAEIPGWIKITLENDELDLNPPGGSKFEKSTASTSKEFVKLFDEKVAEGKAELAAAKDGEFAKPWSLLNDGATIFTMPKLAVIRSFVLNHSIHHRAILGAYLRMNGVKVPGMYGPSGDE
jgi:uncharacterized damage-inducible protein DinB